MLRRLGGAVLFRSSCPSPNHGYPFWPLALTFRSSRPAYGGRLTSPVSLKEIMNEDQPDSLIHMRVSRELKGRWVALSRKEGAKLTDWIINAVEESVRNRTRRTENLQESSTPLENSSTKKV